MSPREDVDDTGEGSGGGLESSRLKRMIDSEGADS